MAVYFDTWAVAAGILITRTEYQGRMHFKTITRFVLETELTNLGRKGRTPAQTMNATLRAKDRVFLGRWGEWWLRDAQLAAEMPKVAEVLKALAANRSEENPEKQVIRLRHQVEQLEAQVETLQRRLAEIAAICQEKRPARKRAKTTAAKVPTRN